MNGVSLTLITKEDEIQNSMLKIRIYLDKEAGDEEVHEFEKTASNFLDQLLRLELPSIEGDEKKIRDSFLNDILQKASPNGPIKMGWDGSSFIHLESDVAKKLFNFMERSSRSEFKPGK